MRWRTHPAINTGDLHRISSVELHHNSTAILKKDIGADSQAMTVKGNRGVAEVGDMNDQASILLCRQ